METDWLIGQLGSRLDHKQNDPELEQQLVYYEQAFHKEAQLNRKQV